VFARVDCGCRDLSSQKLVSLPILPHPISFSAVAFGSPASSVFSVNPAPDAGRYQACTFPSTRFPVEVSPMTRTFHASIFTLLILPAAVVTSAEQSLSSPGLPDWEKGQQAILDGKTEQAIALFQQSLKQEPSLVRNHVSLAAAYLAQGEEDKAAEQLRQYLKQQPDHLVVRGQYAELMLRLDHLDEAREQFERFESGVQDNDALARQHLVHCHSRLLEISTRLDDDYGIHLHRGIALYWLARQRDELTENSDEFSSEGLLCQSASEFVMARRARPDEARPCWYLHEVWSQLAQRQPATRWLRAAEEIAPFSYLTPAEQRLLHFASRRYAEDGSHK
jgi:tetratricopeptide (TPR) repeat protein